MGLASMLQQPAVGGAPGGAPGGAGGASAPPFPGQQGQKQGQAPGLLAPSETWAACMIAAIAIMAAGCARPPSLLCTPRIQNLLFTTQAALCCRPAVWLPRPAV